MAGGLASFLTQMGTCPPPTPPSTHAPSLPPSPLQRPLCGVLPLGACALDPRRCQVHMAWGHSGSDLPPPDGPPLPAGHAPQGPEAPPTREPLGRYRRTDLCSPYRHRSAGRRREGQTPTCNGDEAWTLRHALLGAFWVLFPCRLNCALAPQNPCVGVLLLQKHSVTLLDPTPLRRLSP